MRIQLDKIYTAAEIDLQRRSKNFPQTSFGKESLQLVNRMKRLLASLGDSAIALAAPQMAVDQRVIAYYNFDYIESLTKFKFKRSNISKAIEVLFNPQITHFSTEKKLEHERCLSIPDQSFPISRHVNIIVIGQDFEGKSVSVQASGWNARMLQHEIDHLDGILIWDRWLNEGL